MIIFLGMQSTEMRDRVCALSINFGTQPKLPDLGLAKASNWRLRVPNNLKGCLMSRGVIEPLRDVVPRPKTRSCLASTSGVSPRSINRHYGIFLIGLFSRQTLRPPLAGPRND